MSIRMNTTVKVPTQNEPATMVECRNWAVLNGLKAWPGQDRPNEAKVARSRSRKLYVFKYSERTNEHDWLFCASDARS